MIDINRNLESAEKAYRMYASNIIDNVRLAEKNWKGTSMGRLYLNYAVLEATEAISDLDAKEQSKFIRMLKDDGMPENLLPLPKDLDFSQS